MKNFLESYNIVLYSAQNKRKSVIVQKFIRTISVMIFLYITSTQKNAYINKLPDIVNKHNNMDHLTINIKKSLVIPISYTPYIPNTNKKKPTW